MQATYKGKDIMYDIDTDTYSDGFSTTFKNDIAIAVAFGKNAILDTHKRIVNEWLKSVRYFTDYTMALNHLACAYYQLGDTNTSALLGDLYYKSANLAYKTYKGDDLKYYIGILD